MAKKAVKAFLFGKFLPFHKGHEAMIYFALTHCDFLTVLVCCSDKESISAATRRKWIEKTFEGNTHLEVKEYNYFETELPNTSESSIAVSALWSEKFKDLFPDYELLITSEKYGDYVASFMNIQHIPFDIPKQYVPISATSIRKDLFSNWQYLPDSVKSDLAFKVVILGTESTGKSHLTQHLAEYFNATSVKEVGRNLIENSNSFQFEDLTVVASEHARQIDKAVLGDSPLIIIDTDVHITQSYAQFTFGKTLKVDDDIYLSNKAHLYLYLNNDVEYVQDGTRLDETNRNLLDLSHRKILKQHNIDIVEIRGNWEQRFEKAITIIKQGIEWHKQTFF